MNPVAVVWKDDDGAEVWARVYVNGRCEWVCCGFRSFRKAQKAADKWLQESRQQ